MTHRKDPEPQKFTKEIVREMHRRLPWALFTIGALCFFIALVAAGII